MLARRGRGVSATGARSRGDAVCEYGELAKVEERLDEDGKVGSGVGACWYGGEDAEEEAAEGERCEMTAS